MEKIGETELWQDLIAMRRKTNPDFVYDGNEARKEIARRESQLQIQIGETYMNFCKKEGGLKYSGMPTKYRDMKFSDLLITRENGRMVNHLSKYVKNYKIMNKGIGLVGGMGVGKTTLIAITCKELVERYKETLYFADETTILNEIKRSINDTSLDTPEDVVRNISDNNLIVIDEFGTTTNQWEISQIKKIMDLAIYKNNKVFITSNYSSSELLQRWKDENNNKTPKQVLDRMYEAMDVYKLEGKSFRRQSYKENN